MGLDAISIGLAGFQAASTRVESAAHNLANVQTRDFRPVRTRVTSVQGGRVEARAQRAPQPEAVEPAREILEVVQASAQARSSMRVSQAGVELVMLVLPNKGGKLDVRA